MFVLVTGSGEILDFNDHEVLWLTEDQVETLAEFPPEERYEIAFTYHELNWGAYLKRISTGE